MSALIVPLRPVLLPATVPRQTVATIEQAREWNRRVRAITPAVQFSDAPATGV